MRAPCAGYRAAWVGGVNFRGGCHHAVRIGILGPRRDSELGAKMLLLAAAALAKNRATYLEAAREAFEIARKPVD